MRRTAINAFFSRTSVQQVEPILHRSLDLLCNKIRSRSRKEGFVEVNVILLALTADTIAQYGFGETLGLLEDDNKALDWYLTNKALANMIPKVRQFPWSMPLALQFPVSTIRLVSREFGRVLQLRHVRSNVRIRSW